VVAALAQRWGEYLVNILKVGGPLSGGVINAAMVLIVNTVRPSPEPGQGSRESAS
jgi:hypothetical protein